MNATVWGRKHRRARHGGTYVVRLSGTDAPYYYYYYFYFS